MPDGLDIFGLPLDEYLEASAATEFTETSEETPRLANDDEALWTMRRLAVAQREINRITRQAKAEIERINEWYRANVISAEDTVQTCEALLNEYLVRVRADSADGIKSLTFPDGVISSRPVPNRVEVLDADAFIAWAKDDVLTEEFVRVKEEVALNKLKGMVDMDPDNNRVLMATNGREIPGLGVVKGGISTSIRIVE